MAVLLRGVEPVAAAPSTARPRPAYLSPVAAPSSGDPMSFLSAIKKVGRAIDPTSKSSPLGSLTRTAISVVPGGAAALGAVDVVNKAKPAPKPVTPAPAPPPPSVGEKVAQLATTPAGIGGGLALALGLLVVLLLMRRR